MSPAVRWDAFAAIAIVTVGVLCFWALLNGCTPEARAPIEGKLTAALSDEQVACLIAQHVPGPADEHQAILEGCAIAPVLTGFALTLLQMADRMHWGEKHDGGGG